MCRAGSSRDWRGIRCPGRTRSVPILPRERDPRLITIRRGGTLTDEHHHLSADWACQASAPAATSAVLPMSALVSQGVAGARCGSRRIRESGPAQGSLGPTFHAGVQAAARTPTSNPRGCLKCALLEILARSAELAPSRTPSSRWAGCRLSGIRNRWCSNRIKVASAGRPRLEGPARRPRGGRRPHCAAAGPA